MDTPDPYVISDERFFSIKRKQDTVQPAYYSLSKNSLSGAKPVKEGFRNSLVEGFDTRKLSNVKCYPIDLASQVDDQGNIVIDENTNKPIDPKEASESSDLDINTDFEADVSASGINNIIYWICFGLFFGLLVVFVITFVVYTARGKSVITPPITPVNVLPGN
jgi:hypothetical protein